MSDVDVVQLAADGKFAELRRRVDRDARLVHSRGSFQSPGVYDYVC